MLAYLWRNRERPPLLSPSWIKAWGRRVLALPSLLGISWRLIRLRSRGASIGEGTVVAPAAISGCRQLSIARDTFIGRVEIQAHNEVRIGSNVCINDGVRLITASHDVRDPEWSSFSSPIIIEDFAWIATGAIILPGVRVGRGAVVGAGAVVSKNVPEYAVAVGNPAKIREGVRPRSLNYNPVRLIALHGAWLGKVQPRPKSE